MKYRCIVIFLQNQKSELELLECFLTINVVNFSAWATLLLSLMCLLQAQAAPADPPAEEEDGEDEDAVEESEGNGRTSS